MYKKLIILVALLFVPFAFTQAASEIHVTKDGKALISSAKVTQIAGNTLFTRLYWGDSFIRLTIKTGNTTAFSRATGEATTIAEIKEGDFLDASGELAGQSETLTLIATSIKNSSVQKERTVTFGTVTGINLSAHQFTLQTKKLGAITVNVASSTKVFKGSRTLDLEHLRVGNIITKASGDYDLPTKTLAAESFTIYIDPLFYKPRLFKGVLSEAPSSGSTSLLIRIDDIPFTVFLSGTTTVMRTDKSTTTIERFLKGDSIRLYGTRREVDEPIIDVEAIRNMNL